MLNIFKGKNTDNNLYAPVDGETVALEKVPDPVFSEKMMGDGIAFTFEGDTVCAPCDGTISLIADTKHAFGITSDNKAEVLIHIGFDTVNLQGEGFSKLVEQGDKVKKGTPIIRVDRALMKDKGIDLTTPMVVTNSSDCTMQIEDAGKSVRVGEDAVIRF